MNSIDLKDEVRTAIDGAWPAFAQRHPHLAAAIDQELLVEQATSCIADDPEFLNAIAQASTIEAISSGIGQLVSRLVSRWLRELL